MKKAILFLLLATGFTANAQSLKELLYSGKLKNDSNTVIRKTDDLKSKIDTSQKKGVQSANTTMATVQGDSLVTTADLKTDPATAITGAEDSTADAQTLVKEGNAPVKNNTKIWKDYMDSVVSSLKTEVLSSKKIKKETYYLMVQYEIDTDGQVSVTNVLSTPENEFLQGQIKERLLLGAPQLAPVTDSSNKPRKVKKKYSFTLTKE
jgi:hypothetical protein